MTTESDEMKWPELTPEESQEGMNVLAYIANLPLGHRMGIMRASLWGHPVAVIMTAQQDPDGTEVMVAPVAILVQTSGVFEALEPLPGMAESPGLYPVEENPGSFTPTLTVADLEAL